MIRSSPPSSRCGRVAEAPASARFSVRGARAVDPLPAARREGCARYPHPPPCGDGRSRRPGGIAAAPPDEAARLVGLSKNKADALRDLARKVRDGTVELDGRYLACASDEDIVAHLTTVRGIGRWTAEMFLMFQLRRVDVWPTGDFGVRRGYGLAWKVPMPTAKELEPLGEPFRPYRSVAAWYCWRAVEVYAAGGRVGAHALESPHESTLPAEVQQPGREEHGAESDQHRVNDVQVKVWRERESGAHALVHVDERVDEHDRLQPVPAADLDGRRAASTGSTCRRGR